MLDYYRRSLLRLMFRLPSLPIGNRRTRPAKVGDSRGRLGYWGRQNLCPVLSPGYMFTALLLLPRFLLLHTGAP